MTTSPMPHEDALLSLAFSMRANPGAYAVLVGAGVSAPSGILTAWGVVKDLVSRVARQLNQGEPEEHDKWYEETFGEPAGYESLLEKLAPSPLERQRLLREYFEPADPESESEERKPTRAHRSLARLVKRGTVRILVTLNFDRLLEQALRAEGIEPTIVATAADVAGLPPLHTLECCVIHLHGDYLNPSSMLNTTRELNEYDPQMLLLLKKVLADYGLILAGWSGTYDPALIDAIKTNYPSRYTLNWIEPGTPTTKAAEFRKLMNGHLVPTTADTAFGILIDAVTSLESRSARHPLTVTAAAETAKRELSGRWVAIGLHDRLASELNQLHLLPELNLSVFQETSDGYIAMLERIEEASKVPAALIASLAYWGDTKTDNWWINELVRFSMPDRGSGLIRVLQLRLVAGSALFYAAGVGAVAAGRYELLARLLKISRPNSSSGQEEPLADVLEADRAVDGIPPRAHTFLHPILVESLALGDDRTDDAWQLFEILRVASLVTANDRFGQLYSDLRDEEGRLSQSQESFEAAERSGLNVTERRFELSRATQDRDKALGHIAYLAPVQGLHLHAMDARQRDQRWHLPPAERLARELVIEGEQHPLAHVGIASPEPLSVAIKAVSVAAGRMAQDQQRRDAGPGVRLLSDQLWLDAESRR